jgi:ABC-type Fe3+/spermidine/putrescine transport system ATPase subunit
LIVPEISFVNVTKRFGKVLAIDQVSFEVQSGEYLCVLGPTGSGKTTLLRLIAGLVKPDEGTIYFDHKAVNNVEAHDRNAVYVPQQYALFPHLTVLENVAFGPLARDETEKMALETASKTLDMVRLSWRSQAYPRELSGGMQQRVALARGLASNAGLLLLDEPLGALDARLRVDLRHRLRELVKQSGFTAIHVTHDRDEAMSVADRMMVLRSGRILDHGTPRRVYTKPAGIFVANLVGGANFVEGIVEKSTEKGPIVRMSGGIIIHTAAELLTANEPVILAIRKERIRVSISDLQMDNVLRGEVREVRFLGSSREYIVRLTNGDIVASREFLEGAEPAFRVGEKVFVGFQQTDTTVFPYPSQGLIRELEIM